MARSNPVKAGQPLRPKKSLGQNFLRDQNIARKIVAAIEPQKSDVLVEIGPGEGALTRYLDGSVGTLVVVEIDNRVVEVMRGEYAGSGMEIVHGDFLDTDLCAMAGRFNSPLRIVGNIPYNITSPILFHVLDRRQCVIDLTIMMQREVARRLVARPGTKEYGILAVFCQLFSEVQLLFDVSPNAFYPKPDVTSSVVCLRMLPVPRYPVHDEKFFRAMVRSVFGKRRKTLRNSLKYFLGDTAVLPEDTSMNQRPEELGIGELTSLSNVLFDTGARPVDW